jgi:hypothetical protein
MPKYTKDNLPPVAGPRGDLDGEDLPDPFEGWCTQMCDEPFERPPRSRGGGHGVLRSTAGRRLAPAKRRWLSIPEIAEDLALLAGSMITDEPSRAQGERLLIDALRQHAFDRGGHARVRLRTSERAMRWFSPGGLAVAEEVFREDPELFKKQYLDQLYIRRDVLDDWLRSRGVQWPPAPRAAGAGRKRHRQGYAGRSCRCTGRRVPVPRAEAGGTIAGRRDARRT